tara:strand:- start:690 stop:1097 length:408 start_codon:yes stop_codon:yes gene_type:complete
MIGEVDLAYIAGLIDGEGSIQYKQYMRKRKHNPKAYPTWSIRIEIAMTDRSVLIWLNEILGVGTVNPRKVKPGKKKQWRWRCSHRQAYFVAKLIWPYVHIKLPAIQKIIEHYSKEIIMNNKVVSLEDYKKAMSLE